MGGRRTASNLMLFLALLVGAFTLSAAEGSRRELKQVATLSAMNSTSTDGDCSKPSTSYVYANSKTVKRGVYSPDFPPVAHVQSGDVITAECVTHQVTQDYVKMIKGDPGIEDIYNWPDGVAPINKSVPTYPGVGAHILTGPIAMCGSQPGDILQVQILSLEPRKNPLTGKTYGANTQSNPLDVFKVPTRSGTPNPSTAIVYEITRDEFGAWATPVYEFITPNLTSPDGKLNGAGTVVPHLTNIGVDGSSVTYAPGFLSKIADGSNGITYLNNSLAFRAPWRPHLGTLGVTPVNASKFINGAPNGTIGASSQAPTKSGGNMDDWRVGPGATMYFQVQIPGANLVFGDCHAAMGDSELSGNAVETSLTGTFKLSLIKAADAPLPFKDLGYPLLETDTEIVIHGFAYPDYINQLDKPSQIGNAEYGPDLNKAMRDAYVKTRNFLMDGFALTEGEAISLMSAGVDFGITQIVDANWGIHGIIKKSLFSKKSASKFGRRLLDDNTGKSVIQMMAEWKAALGSKAEL